jgi:hypothetical protein
MHSRNLVAGNIPPNFRHTAWQRDVSVETAGALQTSRQRGYQHHDLHQRFRPLPQLALSDVYEQPRAVFSNYLLRKTGHTECINKSLVIFPPT